jgi:release factor glutamine methyltransferase
MKNNDIEWLLKEKYNGEKSEAFFTDCKNLTLGKPLAYLIGWVPFLDCKIWLDSHPLIPRPETEHWTEKAIKVIRKNTKKSLHVLDLCAGSGCIGIAVAKAIPKACVDFGEIDASHISTIKKNLHENGIGNKNFSIINTDLFAEFTNKYDFILSNPPYIDKYLERTDSSVVENEPRLALFGGKNGLEVINKIIEQSSSYLNQNGQLWIEHEPEQTQTIQAVGKKYGFFVITHTDQYNIERYSTLVLQ